MLKSFKKDPIYTPREVRGLWRGWGWFVVPDWNITIAAPPKAGSSSLKQFFYESEMDNVKMIPKCEVNPNSEIFFVVRDPLDRFASLWRSKCRDENNIKDYRVCGMQPNELMQHILEGNTDVHWAPQVKLLDGLNAKLICLENLNEWYSDRGYGELHKFNATEGDIEIDELLRNQVLTFYAEDAILHARAEKEFKLNIQ